MGVDFFPCDYCGRSVCDCGRYVSCGDECYSRWCSDECAKKSGFRKEDEDGEFRSCNICRAEDAEDGQLLEFLLNKYKLARKDVVKEYYASEE